MSDILNPRVFITPLIRNDEYGDEVEVTDYVRNSGIGAIRRGIDDTDFSFGVYNFGEVKISLDNDTGIFNPETDSRSMFGFKRDRAKVRIVYQRITVQRSASGGIVDSDTVDDIVFRGIIANEGIRQNVDASQLDMRVLSRDAIINKAKVPGGAVANGILASQAILRCLAADEITAVLNVDQLNINVDHDFTIDDGSGFDNRIVFSALSDLMIVTNSALYVDESDNVIVRPRAANDALATLELFGPFDPMGRSNIINCQSQNDGMQRVFTSVSINEQVFTNEEYAEMFGFRRKDYTFDFLTDATKAMDVAAALVGEFKFPRREMVITVPYEVGAEVELLQPVSISWPLLTKPYSDAHHMPVVGYTQIDDPVEVLPRVSGNLEVDPTEKYRVIGIDQDPNLFTVSLKLRQAGTTYGEGVF